MEKALVIFSIVTHDHELMRWFWLFATLPAGLWHLWRFPSNKTLTQKQLVEISSRFTNIDSDYLVFSLLALTILVGLPLLVLAPAWDRWALQRFGIEFYPSITFFSAGYGIFQALFALLTGVYPMARSLSYGYDEPASIRKLAVRQIAISISAIILSILFFFVTA